MSRGRAPKVTEEIFDTVKFMVKGGASISKCSKTLGLCPATISYIKRAKTFEEYRQIVQETNLKKIAKRKGLTAEKPEPQTVEEHKEEIKEEVTATPQTIEYHVTLVANQYMAEQLKKQTELLTLINNKLTLIAEDLGCFREEKLNNA